MKRHNVYLQDIENYSHALIFFIIILQWETACVSADKIDSFS
jgi:hypothetical protein